MTNGTPVMAWSAVIVLLIGGTIRFCLPARRSAPKAEQDAGDEMVARSLDLVSRTAPRPK
jgi:hypothetical protein